MRITTVLTSCQLIIYSLYSLFVNAQHTNILISNSYFPQEPSIAIDPSNTNNLVVAANLKNFYYSSDKGYTWSEDTMISSYGVWGDPCIIVDNAGHYYYFHLSNFDSGSWIDRIVCQKSIDKGVTWSDGTYLGLNGTKAQDKEYATVDWKNNYIYITWSQFDKYDSKDPLDSSIIRFSRSTDGGQTWLDPIRLSEIGGDCLDDDQTIEGAVPAVGPNGEIYVSWAGHEVIMFDKSLDSGITWLEKDIFVTVQPGGWNYDIPGIFRCNGLPITACDTSSGPYRGNIYINWSDQRNGIEDTDIWLIKSTDGGNTWGERKRVNDDMPGKHQFFTWMAIDQFNGYLYFVFYDRRNYSDNNTDVYMAVSKDGGETFTNFKVSEKPFIPSPFVFFGDYINIAAYNNVIRPVWASHDNNLLSIWIALVDISATDIEDLKPLPFTLEQNMPNPFQYNTHFAFKIHKSSIINLKVFDIYGRVVATLINSKELPPGKYIEQFDAQLFNIDSGIYYFSLISNNLSQVRKMLYLK